jgi:hypothetical protein
MILHRQRVCWQGDEVWRGCWLRCDTSSIQTFINIFWIETCSSSAFVNLVWDGSMMPNSASSLSENRGAKGLGDC